MLIAARDRNTAKLGLGFKTPSPRAGNLQIRLADHRLERHAGSLSGGSGNAEMGLERCAVLAQRGAAPLPYDAAALQDRGVIGHGENLARVLLDDNGGEAFLAHDTPQRCQQFLDDDGTKARKAWSSAISGTSFALLR